MTQRGRPHFEPTSEQRLTVQIMSACGMPQEQIAIHIGVDAKTLRKALRAELKNGSETANGLVAQSLFKKATGSGNQSVTAAIFWLKTKAGWKDTQAFELTGKDGGPVEYAGVTSRELAEAVKNVRDKF